MIASHCVGACPWSCTKSRRCQLLQKHWQIWQNLVQRINIHRNLSTFSGSSQTTAMLCLPAYAPGRLCWEKGCFFGMEDLWWSMCFRFVKSDFFRYVEHHCFVYLVWWRPGCPSWARPWWTTDVSMCQPRDGRFVGFEQKSNAVKKYNKNYMPLIVPNCLLPVVNTVM